MTRMYTRLQNDFPTFSRAELALHKKFTDRESLTKVKVTEYDVNTDTLFHCYLIDKSIIKVPALFPNPPLQLWLTNECTFDDRVITTMILKTFLETIAAIKTVKVIHSISLMLCHTISFNRSMVTDNFRPVAFISGRVAFLRKLLNNPKNENLFKATGDKE